jgi:HAD superfamily hydrolase (TIGR01509 family)
VWGDVQLVIFDCDGVLVDSLPIACGVLAQMLTDEGLPTTLMDARHDYQELLLAEVVTRVEAKLGRTLRPDWLDCYERKRADAFRQELEPVPGAAEAAQRIKTAGIGVCVASQGKLSKTNLSLALTSLDSLFPETARFSAYSVANGKPAPDVFLHAAASMGVESTHCVVVEDTASGITAAVAASMRVLGYATDSDEQALRDAGATAILRSLDELPRLLSLE